ncbi:MAG: ATP-binding cassette domain-containing protein [Desulfovibrio sp.]|uniref:ATP-binding cassette domain-containing protein n=1 Tax=Desulfovibrio sp. 7SRBS1 TaxID=3378064 RepID=UPI003B410C5D
MRTPLIEFRDVTKSFGSRTILDRVSLQVFEGEVSTIIGKSGVGKSVLLKHIIGLLQPDQGDILFNGTPIGKMSKADRAMLKSQVSYMFQNNALFDSMTVFENIALPLRERTRLSKKEIHELVMEKIDIMELSEVPDKYPSQISGGMQKRTALARALVTQPRIVLFDEPTTGLDPLRKNSVLSMVAHYQKRFGFTAILVSHDIPDVFYISNRIIILDNGRTLFQGSPLELEQSKHIVVADFIHSLEQLQNELIGLETRHSLERNFLMEKEHRLHPPYSLLTFEVNDLERISEEVGHLAAQHIVEVLAKHVSDICGESCIMGRFNRNTIVTLLPHTDRTGARAVRDRIGEALRQEDVFHHKIYHKACTDFEIRAGYAPGDDGVDLEQLVRQASGDLKVLASLSCGQKSRE